MNFDISDKFRDPASLQTTDWQNAIFRRAPISNYQLSASGGTDNIRYSVSGNYFNQQGVIIESGLKRYNARVNVDGKLSNKWNFGVSMLPSYVSQRSVRTSGHPGELGIINSALAFDPSIPVYNENGTYASTVLPTEGNAQLQNPVKIARELKMPASQFRLLSNAYLEYEILADLKLRSSFGADLNYLKISTWNPSTLSSGGLTGLASAEATNTESNNWLSETTLSYKKTFGAEHALNFVGGFTAQRDFYNAVNVIAGAFSDDLVPNINGGIVNAGSQNTTANTLLSVLARANYSFRV